MTTLVPVAVSPLRQRFIDEMDIRRFGHETQRNYIRDVGRFATFLGRSPDTATAEDVRRFQIEQGELDVPAPTMNAIVSALRFFFTQTLDRPDLARKLVRMRHERKLPVVLSRDEVARLLDATTCLKHQAALSVAYGAGLRASEVASLKVRDIDSERMLLRVERGKGGRYRNAMLPTGLLALLREWWRVGRRERVLHVDGWLFPGQHYHKPLSTRQLHRIVVEASVAAGIGKRVGPHTLRHCFATHLLEDGIDVRIIQTLLGHAKLETTAYYTQVATRVLHNVTSPFDRLAMAAIEARTPSGCPLRRDGDRNGPQARHRRARRRHDELPAAGRRHPLPGRRRARHRGTRHAPCGTQGPLIDFHCHLHLYADPVAVLDGVDDRGTYTRSHHDAKGVARTSALVGKRPRVRVALGLHPELVATRHHEVALLCGLLGETRYVGEIGIDGSPPHRGSIDLQVSVFDRILSVCSAAGGRVMSIHSRSAATAVLDGIERWPGAGVPILHWFSGTMRELARADALGCWFSVGPAMLRSRKGRELAAAMPASRMLTETDAPFGRDGDDPLMPWQAYDCLGELADLKGVPLETLSRQMVNNLRRLPGLLTAPERKGSVG